MDGIRVRSMVYIIHAYVTLRYIEHRKEPHIAQWKKLQAVENKGVKGYLHGMSYESAR